MEQLDEMTFIRLIEGQIDIRKWRPGLRTGALQPTTNGVTLTPRQYDTLRDCADKITKVLRYVCEGRNAHLRIHLGADMYIRVKWPYRCVDIRKWFSNDRGILKPGDGVSLSGTSWQKLLVVNGGLPSFMP